MTMAHMCLHQTVRSRRHKKIARQAEQFLWTNSGDSFGCYGGGKRVWKKMPWTKFV